MGSRLGVGFVLPAFLIVAAGVAGAWALSRYGGSPVTPVPPPGVGPATKTTKASTGESAKEPEKPPLPPFGVMFAGELKGRLFPPSCASIQLGGLERIESAIHAGATGVPFAMALDTGDMTASPGEAGALELQEALIVLMECGVAVSAVGEKDLMLGLDRWRAVKNQFAGGMAVICANLTDDRGIALVPPAALLPTGGRRVLCVATLSPSFEPELRKAGVEVKIGDPAESVRTALESAPAHDFVILI
ncbi:MAG: hypothetical protein ACYTDX_09975, partial [Planctomycetota bacterium]